MKKKFRIGSYEFRELYIENEELQEKFDFFVFTLKLMGFDFVHHHVVNPNSEMILLNGKRSDCRVLVVVKTHIGSSISGVEFEVHNEPYDGKIKKKFKYDKLKDGLNYLYKLFDDFLIYI